MKTLSGLVIIFLLFIGFSAAPMYSAISADGVSCDIPGEFGVLSLPPKLKKMKSYSHHWGDKDDKDKKGLCCCKTTSWCQDEARNTCEFKDVEKCGKPADGKCDDAYCKGKYPAPATHKNC